MTDHVATGSGYEKRTRPMLTRLFTQATSRASEIIRTQIREQLGQAGLQPTRVVIKPNWVLHETDPGFPIEALVTDSRVIVATVEACLEQFPKCESILVGDCPLQSADWFKLCEQSQLAPDITRLRQVSQGRVRFLDLRKDIFQRADGNFLTVDNREHGDPAGYREVELGGSSHLEPISNQADRFAVNDYSAAVTRSNHARGSHRYLVSQSILDADLIINLPKWKSHAKAGLTCALKNLVGINGDKAYLPHFRRGAPKWGGDEYSDRNRWLYWLQTTLREGVQKRSRLAYTVLKPGWEILKRVRGIETRLENREAAPKHFYAAGGAWHGNQTIWRMIYDLNLVVQCVDAAGKLHPTPQRRYFSIVDGLISGEGNGPLQPLPRQTGCLAVGDDPFAIDAALSWFMGFDPRKIPVLSNRAQYLGPEWGDFDLEQLKVELDGVPIRLFDSELNFRFAPAPGWRGHIERS